MTLDWIRRNVLTVSLLLFAASAFLTEVAGALPGGVGAEVAKVAIVAVAAARGLVLAAEALSQYHDSDGLG